MTLVVSDTSPLNLLVRIGRADVLPALFRRVLIPPDVAAELAHPNAPPEVRAFVHAPPPPWLGVRAAATRLALPDLDPGEAAAISLAVELAATILIDERDGRREARARGLVMIGAVGVLEHAAAAGLIPDLAETYDRVRGLRFHIADSILHASLARHRGRTTSKLPGRDVDKSQ